MRHGVPAASRPGTPVGVLLHELPTTGQATTETQRTHAQVREWYQAVADGKITDDPIIGPEWAREWLRWQDGEVDDPLVAVLGMPTAGS